MVSSILRHLWKLSKIKKKFLPLPPIRNSLRASSIQPSSDSILEVEGEISPLPTSVLESISLNHHCNFRFGNFHHSILDSKPLIPLTIPEIDGSTIKIGEIICFLKSEISQFKAMEEYMKSKNLESEFVVSESVTKLNDHILEVIVFAIEFAGEFAIIVFDPGGNRRLPSKSLTDVRTSEKKLVNTISSMCFLLY